MSLVSFLAYLHEYRGLHDETPLLKLILAILSFFFGVAAHELFTTKPQIDPAPVVQEVRPIPPTLIEPPPPAAISVASPMSNVIVDFDVKKFDPDADYVPVGRYSRIDIVNFALLQGWLNTE